MFLFFPENMSQSQNMTTTANVVVPASFFFFFFFFFFLRRRESVFASLAAVSATSSVIRAV